MYKEHLLLNLRNEVALLKQLGEKIEASDLDFRPGEKVRSVLELMQYLSGIGSTMLRWVIKNDMTPEVWAEIRAERATLTLENFQVRLDAELANIERYMSEVIDEDLMTKEVTLPTKEVLPLGAAIIASAIKWMGSYRMQLFLSLKLNGKTELNTRDAWYVNP
jgi:predicted NAD/FAD-binding protein